MEIVNVVATVTLSNPLDLTYIHNNIPGTEFPSNAHWLKMRLPPDNTYIAFYKSGKYLITGKSIEKVKNNADRVFDILKNAGIENKRVNFEIHNIVVSDKVELRNSLENLMYSLEPGKASYEPEQFPALFYKDWGVNFLLFSSGKLILTGLKEEKQAEKIIEKFIGIITS